MADTDLVIPSSIPWDSLKGRDLEECLYWLLDDMGAQDLEWRHGGCGGGGADQGRDIEATFYAPSPDGELEAQRWWVEAKGRAATVAASVVKTAVTNSQAHTDVDVLVIATNAQFSNPTKDWVAEWQATHQRPKVRLWERHHLERMVCRHPSVVVRLFGSALSPQGRAEALRSAFWNRLQLPTGMDLAGCWAVREHLELDVETVLALTVGEMANGDVADRPWPMTASPERLVNLLVTAVTNGPHLLYRAQRGGTAMLPIQRAIAYTVMVSLVRLPVAVATYFTEDAWSFIKGESPPQEFQRRFLGAIARHITDELADVCIGDCCRVGAGGRRVTRAEITRYYKRFAMPQQPFELPREEPEDDDRAGLFVFESHDGPCNAGLSLDGEHRCPLVAWDDDTTPSHETLAAVRTILLSRLGKAGLRRGIG